MYQSVPRDDVGQCEPSKIAKVCTYRSLTVIQIATACN